MLEVIDAVDSAGLEMTESASLFSASSCYNTSLSCRAGPIEPDIPHSIAPSV
jgi:hypothetical protein